ncbi:MAG: hypothetical protein R3183_09915, partial [Oleiphilaceae bacterium]|nr:hypothetical protein [Oleiphilaceae bacterium]
FEFCGLPWDASCLEFHKDAGVSRTSSNLQIREGINQKGVNAFEELDAFFAPYVAQYPWLANTKD